MSFREKNAWIAVVTTLIVWGYYFTQVWLSVAARSLDGQGLWTLFLICMGITVVLMLGLNLLATRHRLADFGREPDELERQMEAGATRVTKTLFEWIVMGIALSCVIWGRDIAASFPADPVGSFAIIVANGLVFAGVVTNVLSEIIVIARFRTLS